MFVPSASSQMPDPIDIGFDDNARLSWLDRSGIDLGKEEAPAEDDVFNQESRLENWFDDTFGKKKAGIIPTLLMTLDIFFLKKRLML